MKRVHLTFGLLLFVAFTVTGRWMRIDFPDKDAIPADLRLLMRSRHIYILFSALMHLLLGVYLTINADIFVRIAQYLASAFLFASSVFLVWAWYVESYQYAHFTDVSRWGIYFALAGGVLSVAGAVVEQKRAGRPSRTN
jgi:hypothetical protein